MKDEGRRTKEEGRRKKDEGIRKKEEGRKDICEILAAPIDGLSNEEGLLSDACAV